MRIDPKRILIVLHGSIGDVTRALPLANLIRQAYPYAKISWSVESLAFPLLEHHPAVNEVILFDRDRWWKSLGSFLAKIRSANFDLVLDLQRHFKSGFISWWTRAPVRVGFHRRDTKEGNWIFNNYYISPDSSGISKFNQYLRFAELLEIESHALEWGLKITSSDERSVEGLISALPVDFAVFFVGSSWSSKQWFPEQTADSVAEIRRRYGLGIVLLGGKGDIEFGRQIEDWNIGEFTNLIGQTTLREAIGILARARLAIGPDTGLMHLAAAVGTPVISLWGATEPAWSGPYGNEHLVIRGKADCSPCYLRRCPIGRICMQSITSTEVVEKAERVIRKRSDIGISS